MEFVRKGRGRFHSGDFTIVRPSGRNLGRDKLELLRPGHDYDFRFAEDQIWLLDDEREIGYATGREMSWDLIIDDRPFELKQLKHGVNHSTLSENGTAVSEAGGGGFPLKIVELNRSAGLSDEQQAFVLAIALLGWRESDRSMMSIGG